MDTNTKVSITLEDDDRKFIKEAKGWWAEVKKQMLWITAALLVGFCIGKLYTWDTTITDCKVLGVFRIANTAFHCKMMVP